MVDENIDEQNNEGDESKTIWHSDQSISGVPRARPGEAVALYDYKAGTDNELSFSKGDNIHLYSKVYEIYCKLIL